MHSLICSPPNCTCGTQSCKHRPIHRHAWSIKWKPASAAPRGCLSRHLARGAACQGNHAGHVQNSDHIKSQNRKGQTTATTTLNKLRAHRSRPTLLHFHSWYLLASKKPNLLLYLCFNFEINFHPADPGTFKVFLFLAFPNVWPHCEQSVSTSVIDQPWVNSAE